MVRFKSIAHSIYFLLNYSFFLHFFPFLPYIYVFFNARKETVFKVPLVHYFASFELNTRNYSVNLYVQSKKILENYVEKYRQEKDVNSDIFYAMFFCLFACNKSMSKNSNGNKTILSLSTERGTKLKDKFNQDFIHLLFAIIANSHYFSKKFQFT